MRRDPTGNKGSLEGILMGNSRGWEDTGIGRGLLLFPTMHYVGTSSAID